MGIRFYCPKGHKLNVKAELAGKIGICPKCGERMLIPLVSTRKSGESRPHDFEKKPELPPSMSPEPPAVPLAQEPEYGTAVASNEAPAVESARPAVPSVSVPLPEPIPEPIPEPRSEPAPVASPLDDPNIHWHIRTLDNQPYGPVSGAIVQSWIREKRIASNMLVWHEGWDNWQQAGSVFPEMETLFATMSQPAQAYGSSVAPVVAQELPGEYEPVVDDIKRSARKKRASRDLLIVIGLILVILLLIAGLLAILFMQERSHNKKTGGEAPVPEPAATSYCVPDSDMSGLTLSEVRM